MSLPVQDRLHTPSSEEPLGFGVLLLLSTLYSNKNTCKYAPILMMSGKALADWKQIIDVRMNKLGRVENDNKLDEDDFRCRLSLQGHQHGRWSNNAMTLICPLDGVNNWFQLLLLNSPPFRKSMLGQPNLPVITLIFENYAMMVYPIFVKYKRIDPIQPTTMGDYHGPWLCGVS